MKANPTSSTVNHGLRGGLPGTASPVCACAEKILLEDADICFTTSLAGLSIGVSCSDDDSSNSPFAFLSGTYCSNNCPHPGRNVS